MKSIALLFAAAAATGLSVPPGTVSAQGAEEMLRTTGVQARVTLTRDSAGIVHIEAQNEHDLFFAQGYSAARDRLFQLELWRRQATGTMAEALGPRWVARDRAARLMRYRGSMKAELAHYHPRGETIIQAFVDGINAWVARVQADPSLMPPDLAALGITPGRWTPAVVVSRHNALASNASDEANLARAVRAIGGEAVTRRRNFEPATVRLSLDSLVARLVGTATDAQLLTDYSGSRNAPSFRSNELSPLWRRAGGADSTVEREADRWESNNWVISGQRTASGRPIVANDPHRAITVPSLRYLVHLKAPGWDVIGGGEPGIPGVAIGHNPHAAWGLTIFGIDSEDLYVYELDAANASYRYRGAFVAFETVRDRVRVKGGATQTVALQYTRHGPVLYVDSTRHMAVALRAGWLEVGGAPYLASLRLDQARTWSEARAALSYARMPALNWIWADTSGTIGWQTAGAAPVRPSWDGLMPVPGDGRFEWRGLLPIPELPSETNPARGFVGTANAFNVAPTYARFDALARTWSDPFRHDRLQQVLDTTRQATVASSGALQHDAVSLPARALVPLLSGLELTSPVAKAARDTLLAWDHTLTAESRAAAIYVAWERKLATQTADLALPPAVRPILRSVPLSRTVQWLTRPDSLLGEQPMEARNRILSRAFSEALQDLRTRFGDDMSTWRYGDARLHHSRITHPLHALVTDSLQRVLSPGPLPRGGYGNTLLATANVDNQNHGASLRVVIEVGDWDNAIVTNSPGQSGDPRSAFYANLFPLWAANRFVPLPYSAGAVTRRAAGITVLHP
ncbi:penicillin acylase family protein [Gemmatimonas sp.]|jgi:penicillin amidase|uniref:penicillin acylase family protein n=1 Tax=Gemmatimonas sp. TaxID=1962908 RepID=UPI0037BE22B4